MKPDFSISELAFLQGAHEKTGDRSHPLRGTSGGVSPGELLGDDLAVGVLFLEPGDALLIHAGGLDVDLPEVR